MTETYENNHARKRFELTVGDDLAAWLDYELRDGTIALNHTEVNPGFRKRGLGGDIVRFALVHAQLNDLHIVPNCSFVARFIEHNTEYRWLVA